MAQPFTPLVLTATYLQFLPEEMRSGGYCLCNDLQRMQSKTAVYQLAKDTCLNCSLHHAAVKATFRNSRIVLQ
jgi:hypothetical protein